MDESTTGRTLKYYFGKVKTGKEQVGMTLNTISKLLHLGNRAVIRFLVAKM